MSEPLLDAAQAFAIEACKPGVDIFDRSLATIVRKMCRQGLAVDIRGANMTQQQKDEALIIVLEALGDYPAETTQPFFGAKSTRAGARALRAYRQEQRAREAYTKAGLK